MEREVDNLSIQCKWCKSMIGDLKKAAFVRGIGNLHGTCVQNAIKAEYEEIEETPSLPLVEAKKVEEEKKENVKILMIDHSNRWMLLADRYREARETFPELEFNVISADYVRGEEYLKEGKFFDFIFLDHYSPSKLSGIVDVLIKMDKEDLPRGVIFYGVLTMTDQKYIEEAFLVPLQLEGVNARVIPLREVVFSKFKEANLMEKMMGA